MNDNEKIHEPQTIEDIRNFIGYFLVTMFMAVGVMYIFAGLFAPFWLPKAFEIADKASESDCQKETRYRWIAFGIISLWFVLSWLFVFVAYAMTGMWFVEWGWFDKNGNILIGK